MVQRRLRSDDEVQISNHFLAQHPHLGFPAASLLELIASSFPDAPATILDVGCGFGEMTCELALRYGNASVTGVDIEPKLIDYASRKSTSLRLDQRCSFHIMNMRDETSVRLLSQFDLLTMLAAGEIYGDAVGAAHLVRSLVRTGGYAVVDTAVAIQSEEQNVTATLAEFERGLTACGASILGRRVRLTSFDRERSIQYLSSQLNELNAISRNTGLAKEVIEIRLLNQHAAVTNMRACVVFQAAVMMTVP